MIRIQCDRCSRILDEDEKYANINILVYDKEGNKVKDAELMVDRDCYEYVFNKFQKAGINELPEWEEVIEE